MPDAVQFFDGGTRYVVADVGVMSGDRRRHMPYEILHDLERGAAFRLHRDECMSQVVKSQAGQAGCLSQSAPCSIPRHLMTGRVESPLPFERVGFLGVTRFQGNRPHARG
jgi:hypothetical protein